MRQARAVVLMLALSACTANRSETEELKVAAEIERLKSAGICLAARQETGYVVEKGNMDWWIIRFPADGLMKDVKAAVSWNPPVPPELDRPLRDLRTNRSGNGILRLGENEFIAVPSNSDTPYIHFFGGTEEGRLAALKLVTFCKP